MAITRTPIIDDSGSGQDGTVLDNAWKQQFYDQIDAALATGTITAWIDVPFSAANFLANTGSWTVEAGDVYTQRYTLIGKTLIYAVAVLNTSVSGGPSQLRVNLPSGYSAAGYHYGLAEIYDAGTRTIGSVTVGTGSVYVSIPLNILGS